MRRMENAMHHRIYFLLRIVTVELCFLPTKFRQEKTKIRFLNSDLKRSEKFTPALYQEKDGVWEGGSVSQFTPVMTFRLWERFSETCLEVSESMEVNGKKTFGYDVPVIYKRERGA